ncbi:ABC transporter permease [Kribbella pittospori]|uniref:ABC transporter permease n=1 Tax=Kribbella pittospori TaxID=722689 RepID=UPI0013F40C11|nr:ABC transporter permease [Kribbella pittospori]
MNAIATAWSVELLKLRRSVVAWVVTPLLVVIVPLASVGSVALARSPDLSGPAAGKFGAFATGPLAVACLEVCGQILSVATLGAGGFAAAWTFGREFGEGTVGALFGLPVPRRSIALAKGLLLLCWLTACVLLAVAVTIGASMVVGGKLGPDAWLAAGIGLGAGSLGVGLALPFAWVATVTRSALGTAGVLVGLVAVTQVIVVLGAGSWFPYAVPSLWAGAGGPEASAGIGPAAVLLTAAVAPAGLAAVGWAWARLSDV